MKNLTHILIGLYNDRKLNKRNFTLILRNLISEFEDIRANYYQHNKFINGYHGTHLTNFNKNNFIEKNGKYYRKHRKPIEDPTNVDIVYFSQSRKEARKNAFDEDAMKDLLHGKNETHWFKQDVNGFNLNVNYDNYNLSNAMQNLFRIFVAKLSDKDKEIFYEHKDDFERIFLAGLDTDTAPSPKQKQALLLETLDFFKLNSVIKDSTDNKVLTARKTNESIMRRIQKFNDLVLSDNVNKKALMDSLQLGIDFTDDEISGDIKEQQDKCFDLTKKFNELMEKNNAQGRISVAISTLLQDREKFNSNRKPQTNDIEKEFSTSDNDNK